MYDYTHTYKGDFSLWELAHMIMEAEKSVCCREPENQESLWYNSVQLQRSENTGTDGVGLIIV